MLVNGASGCIIGTATAGGDDARDPCRELCREPNVPGLLTS